MSVDTTELVDIPGVVGFVECCESGTILNSAGDESEILGNVLVYFGQMANLIGESLGLEGLVEAQFSGRSLSVLHLPAGESDFGVIMDSKVRASDLTPLIERIKKTPNE